MRGNRLLRLLVQFRLPVASSNKPMSLPSEPVLLAGPAAMVKSSKGLVVPLLAAAPAAICGSWLATLPPASELLFEFQGVLLLELKVMLLLKVLLLFPVAALRLTKILLVMRRFAQLLKQGMSGEPWVSHRL